MRDGSNTFNLRSVSNKNFTIPKPKLSIFKRSLSYSGALVRNSIPIEIKKKCEQVKQGSPGVGRNTLFLSSPHLCFIIVFICDLFVSRDDPLMS